MSKSMKKLDHSLTSGRKPHIVNYRQRLESRERKLNFEIQRQTSDEYVNGMKFSNAHIQILGSASDTISKIYNNSKSQEPSTMKESKG